VHIHGKWYSRLLTLAAVISLAVVGVIPATAAAPHRAAHGHAKAKSAANCKTKPKATGTIKYSDWQFPDTLNEYQTGASVSQETIDSLIEGLTIFDHTSKLHPDLLASLPKGSNGGKTFTATLKKGLRWSDGREITAADVKFGWQIGMNTNSGPYCPGIGCDAIARIDTKGKYGLVFHMKYPYAPFILNTSAFLPVWPTSWPNAWNKGDVAAAANKLFQDTAFNFENTSFPTNGAYQVAQFVTNDRIQLTPMKYYHTMSCGARVSNLLFVFYASKPGLIAAASSKATDTTTNYTIADLTTLKRSSSYKTDLYPAYEFEHLTLNVDPTVNGKANPLHDRNMRLALALALDKVGMIQSALGLQRAQAQALVPWTFLINTPGLGFVQPFVDKKLTGQWDPLLKGGKGGYISSTGNATALADAKKLIAKVPSCASGCDIDGVTTSGNPVRQAEFAVMQKNWARIGVRFHPGYIPASLLFSNWDKGAPPHTGKFQVAMWTDVGYPDPDGLKTTMMSQFIDREKTTHSSVNANAAGIHDKVFDTQYVKGERTLDNKVRQAAYNAIQVEMNKQAYWIELYFRPEVATDDGRIGNFSTNPTNLANEWNTFNWYPKGSS